MLDRQLQRELLVKLRDVYPNEVDPDDIDLGVQTDALRFNATYLAEHGLIELETGGDLGGPFMLGMRCTHKGIDFLQDDGGLSAILGVVTVKLHDDTIKELIGRTIRASALPEEEKKRWIDQLRELPAETTKHVVLKLVDLGLEKAPEAIALIGKFLG